MAKPIAVIRIPEDAFRVERWTWKDCDGIQRHLTENKPDYHWFVLLTSEHKEMVFEVFHEKDFTEIQYDELKKMIEEKLKSCE